MYRRPKGAAFVPPAAISRLPLSLLRTALVTRDPAVTAAGIEDYQRRMAEGEDYEPPTLLPQRVLFQQWKSDLLTDDANRPEHQNYLRSAELINEGFKASHVPNSTSRRVKPPPVTYDMAMAARARGSEYLPEPPEDLEPPEIVTRAAPAWGRPTEPPPEAYETAAIVTGERAEAQRQGACRRALFEAAAVQARARAIVRKGVLGR
jgi:hypothetical protein